MSELFADFWIVSKVEFRAYKDDGYARRMMLDFRVPLEVLLASLLPLFSHRLDLTLAFTLSNEDGLTMEKQIRNTSV